MTKVWTFICSVCLLLCLCSLVSSEIHRAKPKYGLKNGIRQASESRQRHKESRTVVPGHSRETWIYSMISATLVGLSGIFPLLVIPLEAGRALRKGGEYFHANSILSHNTYEGGP